ncbi:DUF4397 domain-containing protein [Chitinophaga japonensis]|uniref:Uncharacterized protein DUF4397 n=1 Tax=Chitinophaga japonensis TaxID=104662 RepID=A0A562TF28_CHIJA|nr:DUF4397 domain-containing protein [Chitinophaga japonensis]TWI91874.1 uncharacterized protein DUF4397 [Chitinophaga japonensis]
MKHYFIAEIRNYLLAISAMLLCAIVFSGCSDDDDNPNPPPVTGLMTLNLAPDQEAVDIALSGNLLPGSPLPYLGYSGVYLNIYAAERPVQTFSYLSGNEIAATTHNFMEDQYYSLFVIGANDNYRNLVVMDNFDSLSNAAAGSAYLRFVNAIPDSGNPVVTVTMGDSAYVDTPAAFGAVSGFTAIPPGEISIRALSSTTDISRSITLEQSKIYTALLTGMPGETGDTKTQIRYVVNGMLAEEPGKQDSAAVANSF